MKQRPGVRRAIDRGLEMPENVPPITSKGSREMLFHQRAVDHGALPEAVTGRLRSVRRLFQEGMPCPHPATIPSMS